MAGRVPHGVLSGLQILLLDFLPFEPLCDLAQELLGSQIELVTVMGVGLLILCVLQRSRRRYRRQLCTAFHADLADEGRGAWRGGGRRRTAAEPLGEAN